MTVQPNTGATNDIQGDMLTTTVYFTLNEVAGQQRICFRGLYPLG
jgi:hypothetical protein